MRISVMPSRLSLLVSYDKVVNVLEKGIKVTMEFEILKGKDVYMDI